jgi:hypothetical protein
LCGVGKVAKRGMHALCSFSTKWRPAGIELKAKKNNLRWIWYALLDSHPWTNLTPPLVNQDSRAEIRNRYDLIHTRSFRVYFTRRKSVQHLSPSPTDNNKLGCKSRTASTGGGEEMQFRRLPKWVPLFHRFDLVDSIRKLILALYLSPPSFPF